MAVSKRSLGGEGLANQQLASQGEALQPLLDAIAAGGRLIIDDSLTYAETPTFKVNGVTAAGTPGLEVVVSARNLKRPLIAASAPIVLDIGPRGRLVLEGLVISGGVLQLAAAAAADDEPRALVLRHCTLVPGLSLKPDGGAVSPGEPSLTVASPNPFATVTLEQCIVGALRVAGDATVNLVDCIVDAGSPEAVAFEGTVQGDPGVDPGGPGAEMTIQDSTVIGTLHGRLMRLASNTIFFARPGAAGSAKTPLRVERKQEGCVRFSFVPEGSLVPKRFRCVPDARHPDAVPDFTSLRYGDPGYAQLRRETDEAIRTGADPDGDIAPSNGSTGESIHAAVGEIGVMHPLYQPQREMNLRLRLDEYLRFGLHAGIFYVT